MPVPEFILYLTESDVQQTMTVAEAVDLAEKGIQADGFGRRFERLAGATRCRDYQGRQQQQDQGPHWCARFHVFSPFQCLDPMGVIPVLAWKRLT